MTKLSVVKQMADAPYVLIGAPDRIARFWEMTEIRGEDDCWHWEGTRVGRGYGQFNVDGQNIYAHRFSYAANKGTLHRQAKVRHKCDNILCVNPKHLIAGTQRENIHDMYARGRNVVKDNSGENNPRAIVTQAQAFELRHRVSSGELTTKQAAAEYGLSYAGARLIVIGRNWPE